MPAFDRHLTLLARSSYLILTTLPAFIKTMSDDGNMVSSMGPTPHKHPEYHDCGSRTRFPVLMPAPGHPVYKLTVSLFSTSGPILINI